MVDSSRLSSIMPQNPASRSAGGLETGDDGRDVQGGRVERGDVGDDVGPQEEGQFGSSENHAVDVTLVAEPADERDDLLPRVVAEFSLEQLPDVALVNPAAVRLGRDHDLDT